MLSVRNEIFKNLEIKYAVTLYIEILFLKNKLLNGLWKKIKMNTF
jgi:hypothetical protein